MKENNNYQLVLWPYSQNFIGHKECYFLTESTRGDVMEDNLSQGVFVPENLFNGLDPETLSRVSDGFESIYLMADWPECQDLDGYVGTRYTDEDEEEDIAVFFDPNKIQ